MNNRYKKVHILLVLTGFLLFGTSFALAGGVVSWGEMVLDSGELASHNFTAIASGFNYNIALKSDGSIVGWGDNEFGQATPPTGNDFVAISSSVEYSLALKSDGSIVGWGQNWYGETHPPAGNDFVAIAAGWCHGLSLKSDGSIVSWGNNYANPPAGNNYVAITAGASHSLALKSDGSIVGWGLNDYGEATPPAGNDYVAIAAGRFYSLALKSDGSIIGWGNNDWGQTTSPEGYDFVAIAVCYSHSLALKSDGSIVGWGYNGNGEATPPAGNDYIAITAGSCHSLALRSDGSMVGWGNNDYGQANPPTGNDFVDISTRGQHSLSLKSDGSIFGWGDNDYGQATPPAGNNYVIVAAGYRHSLALKLDGSIVGWGWNDYGQATPPAGNDYVAIAGGYYHSLALKLDGSIVGWGRNNYGQAAPPAGNDFVAISAGGYHGLALKSDGSIVGWGRNNYGQATPPAGNDYVAIAAGQNHSLALKADGSVIRWGDSYQPPAGNNYITIATGWEHSLALKSDGSIVGWDRNDYGQATPPTGNNFVAIAAGYRHSLALKDWILFIVVPNGTESWYSGTTRYIQWEKAEASNIQQVKIEYSSNNGQDWNYIDTVANTGSYNWLIPNVNSNQCRVRISDASDPTKNDISNNAFTINNITRLVPSEYATIQAAIDAAGTGDMVIVEPGTYNENINFGGKNIILTSTNPADAATIQSTIIDGGGLNTTVRFAGSELDDCELRGFTITGGAGPGLDGAGINGINTSAGISYCNITGNTAANKGGGIKGVNGAISNCRIVDNSSGDLGGGLAGCMGTISNCIIAYNTATNTGGGLNNCDGDIINCTIFYNSAPTGCGLMGCDGVINNCIIWSQIPSLLINSTTPTYSCYQEADGGGNIDINPRLVDAANGDYHLRGDSLCIDRGDPGSDFSREQEPDGGRINMGAYGNTQEATSKGDLALAAYNLVEKSRCGRTLFDYVYTVSLANHGAEGLCNISLELLNASSNVTIIDPAVGFDIIAAGESAESGDGFTIRVDRTSPVNVATISWRASYEECPGGASAMQVFTSNIILEPLDNPGGEDGQLGGDITGDGKVDLKDLTRLASQWLGAPVNPSADIAPSPAGDGVVNLLDLVDLAENWLAE